MVYLLPLTVTLSLGTAPELTPADVKNNALNFGKSALLPERILGDEDSSKEDGKDQTKELSITESYEDVYTTSTITNITADFPIQTQEPVPDSTTEGEDSGHQTLIEDDFDTIEDHQDIENDIGDNKSWTTILANPTRLPIPSSIPIITYSKTTSLITKTVTMNHSRSVVSTAKPKPFPLPADLPLNHSEPFHLISLSPQQRSLHNLPLIVSYSQLYLLTTHEGPHSALICVMLKDGSVRVLERPATRMLELRSWSQIETRTSDPEQPRAMYLSVDSKGFFGIRYQPMFGFKIRSGALIFQDEMEFGIDRPFDNDFYCFGIRFANDIGQITGTQVDAVHLGVRYLDSVGTGGTAVSDFN